MKRICINASNLHNGGGVQVATSFIDELSHLGIDNFYLCILASSEVAENLRKIRADVQCFDEFHIHDSYGLGALLPTNVRKRAGYDLVFTVFGPDYNLFSTSSIRLVGFAQAWILNLENEIYRESSWCERIKIKSKYFVQKLFFMYSDALVVELEFVRKRLADLGVKAPRLVHVAHNSFSSVFLDKARWKKLNIERSSNFCMGFVGRDYPHKNTKILPEIKRILKYKYKVEVDFYVTFNEEEWGAKDASFRSMVFNVGAISMAECPSFYSAVDAVIFPSFLECFSATPLEAMVMERPLFASDRDFVRDVCEDYIWYFDPSNAESAADVIYNFLSDSFSKDKILAAKKHAMRFSSAKARAVRYIEIVEGLVGEKAWCK